MWEPRFFGLSQTQLVPPALSSTLLLGTCSDTCPPMLLPHQLPCPGGCSGELLPGKGVCLILRPFVGCEAIVPLGPYCLYHSVWRIVVVLWRKCGLRGPPFLRRPPPSSLRRTPPLIYSSVQYWRCTLYVCCVPPSPYGVPSPYR